MMLILAIIVILVMRYSHYGIKKAELALHSTRQWCDAGDRLTHYLREYSGGGSIKNDLTFKRLLREVQENQIFFWEHHLYCLHEKEMTAFLKQVKSDKELYQRALRLSLAKFGGAFLLRTLDDVRISLGTSFCS